MIYRSNLTAPDLRPHFEATTEWRVRPWSMGHDIPSDRVYEPECGFLSDDEAAILYRISCIVPTAGRGLDIGARFGWTSAHILAAGARCISVDPIYKEHRFLERFLVNTVPLDGDGIESLPIADTAADVFAWAYKLGRLDLDLAMIDADHDAPEPLNDARGALAHLADTGVIVFHDFWGEPIRDGVRYLISHGLKCRVYNTPAGMAVCWRGDFKPPDHVPDPAIDWVQVRRSRAPEFDWSTTC